MRLLKGKSDQELIQMYVGGQESGLEALLNRYKSKIYTSIYMKVKDEYLAEDIFQETFIKIINTLKSGKYNEEGELIFVSRKDNQIKHMGHRIELGEIEIVANMMKNIQTACCLFDNVKKKIILFYVGDVTTADVANYLKEKLPRYMVPNVIRTLDKMPLTANGKIDRVGLKEYK